MLTAFQVCFWLGVVVTVVNAVLGAFFDVMDFGLDLDFDFDLGDLHFDLGNLLPLTPSLFFLFLTVFGGVGMLGYTRLPLPLLLVLAICGGLLLSGLVNHFIVAPLRRISAKESGEQADFVGLPAQVSERIFENGYGRITFTFDGNIITAPAKTSDGAAMETGAQVVVLEIKDQVYIVELLK